MKLRNYILICGYGRSGQVLVENLRKHKYDILIIEKDPKSVLLAESHNLNVIKEDATNIDLLKKLNITKYAKYVVALSNSDSVNLSIILSIRSINKSIPIIARANRFKTKNKLKIAGATNIIDVNETTSLVAHGYVNSPSAFEAIDDILIDQKGALLAEIEIFETSHFIGKKLSAIDFDKFNINFIGIVEDNDKNNFIFNPIKKDTTLKLKDILIVIGYERTIKELQTYIQTHNNRIFS
jgi:voltage-gated potassium channel